MAAAASDSGSGVVGTEAAEEAVERVMIVVDASDSARNGDWAPDRLTAVARAAERLVNKILDDGVNNLVGIVLLGGPGGARVLTSLTRDSTHISPRLSNLCPQGKPRLTSGLRLAALALRLKPVPDIISLSALRYRIVAFLGTGSVWGQSKETELLAMDMNPLNAKKIPITVHMILYAEAVGEEPGARAFLSTLPPDPRRPHELLLVSPGKALDAALLESPIYGAPTKAPSDVSLSTDTKVRVEVMESLGNAVRSKRREKKASSPPSSAPPSGANSPKINKWKPIPTGSAFSLPSTAVPSNTSASGGASKSRSRSSSFASTSSAKSSGSSESGCETESGTTKTTGAGTTSSAGSSSGAESDDEASSRSSESESDSSSPPSASSSNSGTSATSATSGTSAKSAKSASKTTQKSHKK